MKTILPELDSQSSTPLYLQLYIYLKNAILNGNILPAEKLPSLRSLAKHLGLSLTTIELAYSQLLVEGYVESRPQSGFYVKQIGPGMEIPKNNTDDQNTRLPQRAGTVQKDGFRDLWEQTLKDANIGYYDISCFDFNKWKKCINKVLTEYPRLLLREGNPKGESPLRYEISRYVYQSRGVICNPEQIVIGAGTQQIMGQLCTILNKMGIKHVAVEEPGYAPVRNTFRDRDFAITPVPVGKEGIKISKLPTNIRSAVYVNPSNQFPTGYVMPIGKRYELLHWAENNNSYIIEDDYDSELRYFGKPIPSLQGLDTGHRVIYLGSFSSTLFASIKISYMVLPSAMAEIFDCIVGDYTQTCSKAEQLTLAIYMEKGFYQTNIKKLRTLYSQKLQAAGAALNKYGSGFIRTVNSSSGINMLITVKSDKSSDVLCQEAADLGISTLPITTYTEEVSPNSATLIFYYNQIPLKDMEQAMEALVKRWKEQEPQNSMDTMAPLGIDCLISSDRSR